MVARRPSSIGLKQGIHDRDRDPARARSFLIHPGILYLVVAVASETARGEGKPPESPKPEAAAPSPAPKLSWKRVDRVVLQEQGSWRVDYRLHTSLATPIQIAPEHVIVNVDGWVSNSRVASHAAPRRSKLTVGAKSGSAIETEIVPGDDARRCKERLTVKLWTSDIPEPPDRSPNTAPTPPEPLPKLAISPGATLSIRLKLEHEHFLHGPYDPLLGRRDVSIKLGDSELRDVLDLDFEQYFVQPSVTWPDPPEEQRDPRHFITAPDSLHLEAHIPGKQYYRYPERPVRYGSKLRFSFWYLIAPGGEGEFRARIAQYKDSPNGWQVLHDGCQEKPYTTVGRWTKVERILRAEPEATSLALDFRIVGADVGEVWIDDVRLEPVEGLRAGP